jgi:DNA-binding GntR family transcriptional regulator
VPQDLTALGTVDLLWEQWPTWRIALQEHREILDAGIAHRPAEVEKLLHSTSSG